MLRGRPAGWLLVIFALGLALAVEAPSGARATTALDWRGCGRFECATLSVPLDYANASSRQIELALVRQPARDATARLGSLLVNPGGPGASANDFLRAWAPSLPREITNVFDIVSFDPRGVGASSPLDCHDNIQQIGALDPNPATSEDWRQIGVVLKAFADLCAQRGGDLLAHVGTRDVARDMDAVRQALGEEKLTYFGYSYGTILGAVYADLFPDRVRAIVLDGAADASLSTDVYAEQQARGFENALQRFLDDCRARQCIAANRDDPGAAIDELLRRARAAPIAARAERPAGAGEVMLAILNSLYSDRDWAGLARAIDRGLNGDGSDLIRLADLYLGRNSDGSYDNIMEMNNAVSCVDYVFAHDQAHYETLAKQLAVKAPRFGPFVAQGSFFCAFWTAPASPLTTPLARGAPPLLVIGTSGDPATPYSWAVSVSKQLASSTLLTNYAEGHTAYRTGSQCIDGAVQRYLITLELPPPDTSCGDAAAHPVFVVSDPPVVSATPQPAAEPTAAATPEAQPSTGGGRDWALPIVVLGGVLAILVAGFVFSRSLRRP